FQEPLGEGRMNRLKAQAQEFIAVHGATYIHSLDKLDQEFELLLEHIGFHAGNIIGKRQIELALDIIPACAELFAIALTCHAEIKGTRLKWLAQDKDLAENFGPAFKPSLNHSHPPVARVGRVLIGHRPAKGAISHSLNILGNLKGCSRWRGHIRPMKFVRAQIRMLHTRPPAGWRPACWMHQGWNGRKIPR